jgi:translation initiation factor IF-2
VRANKQARDAAERDGVEIRYYNIIYDLVDDVKAAMSGLLVAGLRETFLGNAEILEVFNITKVGKVAGCRVTEGKVERGAGVRLIRDNVVIHEGKPVKDERSSASRTRSRKCIGPGAARNAAWRSRTTRTCAPAT